MAEDTEVSDLVNESGSNLELLNNLIDKKDEVVEEKPVDDTDVSETSEEDKQQNVDEPDVDEEVDQELENEEQSPIEEEEESEEEEALEDIEEETDKRTSLEPPLFRELQKKNPELFKSPLGKQLRSALFREHKFSQVFTSIDEATEAAERVEDFQDFESSIMEGDATRFVGALGSTSKEALAKFVDNLLPALYQGDQKIYAKVTSKVITNALALAKKQGQTAIKNGDTKRGTNLVNSVNHIANLIWPSLGGNLPEFPEDKETPEIEAKKQELEEKERRFYQQAGDEFRKSVKSISIKLARKKILTGLDPNNSMPDFVKDSIVDKTLREIGELMDNDPQHAMAMQRLWSKAFKQGFPKELQAKLIRTYLSRASQLIGSTRRKYLAQATGKASTVPGGDKNKPPLRKPVGQSTSSGRQKAGGVPDSKEIDWSKTSTKDALAGKFTLKKR